MSDLQALLDRLHAVWIEPGQASLDELARMLQERQEILARIQKADTSALCPETRRSLAQQLRATLKRDERLRVVLESRRAELLQKLDRSLHSRNAARSYRGGARAVSSGLDRRA